MSKARSFPSRALPWRSPVPQLPARVRRRQGSLEARAAPPNLMIVFGNSQSTKQPILGNTSAWDGDGDSPASKMGAAKRVMRQFVNEKHTGLNIGLTTFAHDPNAGSIAIYGKHWLYSPLTEDFPLEPWKEPAGTFERWGIHGEGPCTNLTVPVCTDRSLNFVTLPPTRRSPALSSAAWRPAPPTST